MILNPMNLALQAKVGLHYTDDICRDPSPSKVTFLATGGLDLNTRLRGVGVGSREGHSSTHGSDHPRQY